MIHTGNLEIKNKSDAEELAELTGVTGDLYIYSDAKLDVPKLYPKGFKKFCVLDNIGCFILSRKKIGDIKILNCRESKIKNKKVVGNRFFIATKGSVGAHGKTINEAITELNFKMGSRDVSAYKSMPLDTVKTPDEWIMTYRTITGACRYGIEKFMKTQGKLKKSYTLSEVLDATKGSWGHDQFKRLVT